MSVNVQLAILILVSCFPQKKLIQISGLSWTIFHFFQDFLHQSFKTFPGLSRTFFHFFQDFLHQHPKTFPGLSTKFQDFPGLLHSCTNSSNKISFLQNKNIHPVIFINNSSFYSKSKNKYLS